MTPDPVDWQDPRANSKSSKNIRNLYIFCEMGPPRGSKSSKLDSFLYYLLKSKNSSKFIKIHQTLILHIKPMVFKFIFPQDLVLGSFWAPCFFVVAVFQQKQMVFASFMYYICSSLFHFEISSFMQKNICFSHFRPRIKNLDISSFVTRPGWYSFFRRHVRKFFIFTHWCHLEIASNMYVFYTFGLGRKT